MTQTSSEAIEEGFQAAANELATRIRGSKARVETLTEEAKRLQEQKHECLIQRDREVAKLAVLTSLDQHVAASREAIVAASTAKLSLAKA